MWHEKAYTAIRKDLVKSGKCDVLIRKESKITDKITGKIEHEFGLQGRFDPETSILLIIMTNSHKLEHIIKDSVQLGLICCAPYNNDFGYVTNLYLISTGSDKHVHDH